VPAELYALEMETGHATAARFDANLRPIRELSTSRLRSIRNRNRMVRTDQKDMMAMTNPRRHSDFVASLTTAASPITTYRRSSTSTWRRDESNLQYTDQHSRVSRSPNSRDSAVRSPSFQVSASRIPIVFTAHGRYGVAGGGQKSAFCQGAVYFRHGAKSEPGTRTI